LNLVIVNPQAWPFGGDGGQRQRRNGHQKQNDTPQEPWCLMHEKSPAKYPLVFRCARGQKRCAQSRRERMHPTAKQEETTSERLNPLLM
jgi:hypothetical protein